MATASNQTMHIPVRKKKRTWAVTLRIVAILFWSSILLKLLIVDIDLLLLGQISPRIAPYKFFIIGGLLIIFWVLLGNKRFWKSILFVLFYPVILVFWDLARLAFKNWMSVLVLAPLVIAAARPVRAQAIATFLAFAAAIFILNGSETLGTVISMAVLFVYLTRHYCRQFFVAFALSRFFARMTSAVGQKTRAYRENHLLKDIREAKTLPIDTPEYAQKQLKSLFSLLLLNTMLQFLARRLKGVQESQLLLTYALVPLAYTVVLTVLVFALEYFALFNLDNTTFTGSGNSSFLFFLFFSFTTFLTASFGTFAPAGAWARLLISAELICTMLVGAILVFIFTTVIREQHREQLNHLINDLERQGDELNTLMLNEFGLTLSEALGRIEESDPKKVQIITLLSK